MVAAMRLLRCPCCSLPTLSERGIYEICVVCWWEDDGQDDPRADEAWGGPNGKYSLTTARRNFASHGHMYDSGQGIDVVEQPSAARRELLAYAKAALRGVVALDEPKLQALMENDRSTRD